ncbi:MAG: hypothetical protein MJ113_03155 [Lachnospiraceae bacterium]|nr:hypothetical protein [Lachnospiraceae bacterium]
MNDIIKVKNTAYARYEEVLLQRDNLKKEAFLINRKYVAEFGDLIIQIFEKKIECIRKKKEIEFVQASINHGKTVDQEKLQEFLRKEMEEFKHQLDIMVEDTKNAKESEKITEHALLKIKRIYHKLVKLIHPDINPLTEENEELSDLWQRAQIAYNCNDLKGMEEADVLIRTLLERINVGVMEIEIPNIEEKIQEIENEIKNIRETDPYMYKYILEDKEMIDEKKQCLKEEYKSFEDYSLQLDKVIEGLMSNGVRFTWRMN